LPNGALQGGADGAVTSIHKTLGGFSGTALLNIASDKLDFKKIKQ
jgi:arginine/lysine/ornithine decarboxylase